MDPTDPYLQHCFPGRLPEEHAAGMEVHVLPAVQGHVVPLHRQLGHVHEEAACQCSPYRVRITGGLYRHACAIKDLVEERSR